MNRCKQYCLIHQFNLQSLENVEEKKLIHQFENKNIDIDTDHLKGKYVLNQIR